MGKLGKRRKKQLPEEVLSELAAIGLSRATDCLCVRDGKVELKAAEDMGSQTGAAIAAIEKTATGWKVRFYDKLKALELLGNYLGLFEAGAGKELPESNLLEAIVAATKEEMDARDIPEIQQKTDTGHDLVEQAGAKGI